jgi:hypothetical protein
MSLDPVLIAAPVVMALATGTATDIAKRILNRDEKKERDRLRAEVLGPSESDMEAVKGAVARWLADFNSESSQDSHTGEAITDLRRTASADDPGPVRGPLQRAAPSSQPPAPPAPPRPPCRRPFPGTDPASGRPRRPHQRVRAGRIESQVRTSGRVLEPHTWYKPSCPDPTTTRSTARNTSTASPDAASAKETSGRQPNNPDQSA